MRAAAARWTASLRLRLLAATLVALALALGLAWVGLAGLFRDHVMRQFDQGLAVQLDQVTARLAFDAAGQPQIDATRLSDPRWTRPFGGLYWQLDSWAGSAPQPGLLRSRSLWDTVLRVPADALADGALHLHDVAGPDGAPLRLIERTVRAGPADAANAGRWRLIVAADPRELNDAVGGFAQMLAASLAVLLVLLGAAAWAQVTVGLAPLRALQRALAAVHGGRATHVEGRFPAEVQPLVDDFNAVLARHAEVVARARTQAGNLAHALKTPLAVLAQAAGQARQAPAADAGLAALVAEQVAAANRQVSWHLARARAAAAVGLPGPGVPVAPVVDGLLRVMGRVHAERGLDLAQAAIDPRLAFAGEQQDLQEMLGNLLDNACQWARQQVRLAVTHEGAAGAAQLVFTLDDDGPGIAEDRRQAVLARGQRLDESVPGSGLGLAIVDELATLYGGRLRLAKSPLGGLRVVLALPARA